MSANPTAGADPVTSIRRFVGRPDLPLVEIHGSPPPTGRAERAFVTPDRDASFFVAAEDNQMLSAWLPPGLVSLGESSAAVGTRLDRSQAREAAEAFLAERVVGFAKLELFTEGTDEGKDEDDQAILQYRFQWGEWLGSQRARGPQFVGVSVDGLTRSLISFYQGPPVTITVDVEPTVGREEALAIARELFGASAAEGTAELCLWYPTIDHTQPLALWWDVNLVSDEPWAENEFPKYGVFYIDAHSGAVFHSYVDG